jgi:Flp pilus assembly protein TadB
MSWGVRAEIDRADRLLSGFAEEVATDATPEKIISGSLGKLQRHAGLSAKDLQRRIVRVSIVAAISLVFALLTTSIVMLAPALVWAAVEWLQVKQVAHLRALSFESDYTALLLSLASAVRTGRDPLSALEDSPGLFNAKSEVRREIEILKSALERGATEDDAVKNFGSSIDHPDVKLFTTAFILARREGASLAESLQRLARVTRQRQSFRRKTRAAVAMQKLSAFGISGCAIVICVIQGLSNPEGIMEAFHNPLGVKLLSCGVFLIVGGLLWMLRISAQKV